MLEEMRRYIELIMATAFEMQSEESFRHFLNLTYLL